MKELLLFLSILFLTLPLSAQQEKYKNEFYIGRGYQKISWTDKYKKREMNLTLGVHDV